MLLDHAWILEERKYFGKANTAYDFKANDPKEAARRMHKLQETKDKLSKSVNMRAMNMLGKAEEQVRCLSTMGRNYQTSFINNNKKKIYNAHIVMNHESEARAVARWPNGVC